MASESRRKQPKPWKWRLEWLAQTGVEKLAAMLPGPMVYRLGEKLGGAVWWLMKARRKIVLRNLRIAFHGEHDLPTLRLMVRENFRRTVANLLSALHSTGLSPDQVDRIVSVENPQLVTEAFNISPGIAMMPPHMGNWEILTRAQRKFPPGQALGAFYRPLNNPLLDARVLAQREAQGGRLFSKRDSFHQAVKFLREGGILGILADQRVGTHGELVRFFGRLTRASPLPSLMARRSRSAILAMGVIHDVPGKWIVRYEPVNGKVSTETCMDAVERVMRASPLDVFWFQERWKVYFPPGQTIRDWLGPDDCGIGKPHRAVLWLSGVSSTWQPPEAWNHPDVIYEAVVALGQAPPTWLPAGTRIHEAAMTNSRDEMARALEEIDEADALPIDYILTCDAPSVFSKAARRECIPLISLSMNGVRIGYNRLDTPEE